MNTEQAIKEKKIAIQTLNKLLEDIIKDNPKRGKNLAAWIKQFSHYIDFENQFDPKRNIAYKRGDVVKLEFGFNVGSEYGGIHYAIVLDNHNAHSSPVVTVIPLTSLKDSTKGIHKNSVDLGNELYRLVKLKFVTVQSQLEEDIKETEKMISTLITLVGTAKSRETELEASNLSPTEQIEKQQEFDSALHQAEKILADLNKKKAQQDKQQQQLKCIKSEIAHMKEGSIALVNQVTTISKIRIYDPKKTSDVLADINISEDGMKKINQKLCELYVFEKEQNI